LIRSIRDKNTQALWNGERVKAFVSIHDAAVRKLGILNAATSLNDLKLLPGNHLEALKRDRKGQHSIRINRQWRVCFRWAGPDAFDVEIVDYH
jgi:proteic killer suppression protein